MFRLLFRLAAMAALSMTVIFAVIDAARSVANSRIVMTPLGQSWETASPETLAAAEEAIRGQAAWLWDPVAVWVLAVPGFVIFAVLALLLFAIGRRPARRLGRLAPGSRDAF